MTAPGRWSIRRRGGRAIIDGMRRVPRLARFGVALFALVAGAGARAGDNRVKKPAVPPDEGLVERGEALLDRAQRSRDTAARYAFADEAQALCAEAERQRASDPKPL